MVNSCQVGKQERISAGKTRTCLRPGAKIRRKAWPWPIQCQSAPGAKNRRLGVGVVTWLLSSFVRCRTPPPEIRCKLWVQRFLGSLGWAKVSYDWSIVLKATIHQSERTIVQPNDPKNLCAESLYPFPWPDSFCTYLRREKNLFSVRDKNAASSSYNNTWYKDRFM